MAIHAAGLDGYYQRTPEGEIAAPPPPLPAQLEYYDLDAVQEEFVADLGATREIELLIEGIHCAACVWLIENALHRLPGVLSARVNLTGRRLHLCWAQDQQPLSAILQRLGELGYAALPFAPQAAEARLQQQQRQQLYRLAFAGFAAMNLMWIAIALYSGADDSEFRPLLQISGALLATPTLLYSAAPFFVHAWRGLRAGYLSMDVPIALGATITYLVSLQATLSGSGAVYWDTLVNFIFVILLGRYLEGLSRRKAVTATQRLHDLQPRAATCLRDGEELIVPLRAVKPGERLLIRPGEIIPADGVVVRGESLVDEALLSGEAHPVTRSVGQAVTAGTLNQAGVLEIEVTATLSHTTLGRIVRLVEEAQSRPAPIQALADRLVPWFVSATLTLALLTALWWWGHDPATAVLAATAVLIITCPCALGLATPMALAVATGLGAQRGIVIKQGAVFEQLSTIDHVVFDKTGTLTLGRPELKALHDEHGTLPLDQPDCQLNSIQRKWLQQIAALERFSEHPLARALTSFATAQGLKTAHLTVNAVEIRPGRGIAGQVNDQHWVLGTARWLNEHDIALNSALGEPQPVAGETWLHAACNGVECLRLRLWDPLRPDAAAVIAALQRNGCTVTLLTGDHHASAAALAESLVLDQCYAEVLPEDKAALIERLRKQGARVAMIGDGINDAPALLAADVGMAMGSGAALAQASADVVLLGEQLAQVVQTMRLTRLTLRTIRHNIGLSIAYNLIMVPLAMAALVTPLVAAIAMPLSSLAVIGNSALIRVRWLRDAEN